MTAVTLQNARAALVHDRVMKGVADVLARNDDLTFAKVADAAGVPERTVYRHFPTRDALMAAVYEWANRRVGFDGARPTRQADAVAMVRRAFRGFDEIAPIVHELLVAPEGHRARAAQNDDRRRAAVALVRNEAPDVDRRSNRRVAAAIQALTTAATWQTLRDVWDMDGDEAGQTAALAIELIIEGAQARATKGRKRSP